MTKEKNKHKAKNKEPNRVDIREEKEEKGPRRRTLNETY
ncbi:hypothetical protein SAMN05428976_10253 [Clostridium sp. USBA 49]|nr:hypothetical protein SAMN05428976_10253 [Clostridium sp. USBA 49]